MDNAPQPQPSATDWSEVERVLDRWGQHLQQMEAERKAAEQSASLSVHSRDEPRERQTAEDLFWQLPE
jgi:hypothetical protein